MMSFASNPWPLLVYCGLMGGSPNIVECPALQLALIPHARPRCLPRNAARDAQYALGQLG